MLRLFDFFISFFGLIICAPIFIILLILGYLDNRSPLFIQERVGRNKYPFKLVKFRSMKVGTPSVATHLASANAMTKYGSFLRRTKLDELPQLWNVLKGEMSLVGPRPNLFNQAELIEERSKLGIYKVRPGITGLAQIKNIDMSRPALLAKTDAEMINSISAGKYFKYIFLTITGNGSGDPITQS